MVDLLHVSGDIGSSFLIGFAEGFLIAAFVSMIKAVVRVFKRAIQ